MAAQWFAGHGYPVEAIRHAQAAQDWEPAGRLLADHWPGLHLDGQVAVIHRLLAGFPAGVRAADAVLSVLSAADELAQGSLEAAEQCLWHRRTDTVERARALGLLAPSPHQNQARPRP